ncbi:hypothetical protein Tco_1375808 [Tanacetum coccineum]
MKEEYSDINGMFLIVELLDKWKIAAVEGTGRRQTEDLEDHLKTFTTAAKVERWVMPTWCYMFNSTLLGSTRMRFDELPPESIDSFKDLRKKILAQYLQQKRYTRNPVELHHVKRRMGSL